MSKDKYIEAECIFSSITCATRSAMWSYSENNIKRMVEHIERILDSATQLKKSWGKNA